MTIITVEVLTQNLTEEIVQAKADIRKLQHKYTREDLTDADRIEYYQAKKTLCEYACNFSRRFCTFDEQKRLEKKFDSTWRRYTQLKREKQPN